MTQNLDPFEMWKNFYNQSQSLIDEKMKEQFPSQAMGQLLDMNLLYQKLLNETTERYFQQMNVPTRTDIAKLSSLIVNVDSKVDDIEELLEEANAKQLKQADQQSEIGDLRNELKNLGTKLNQILDELKSLKEANNKEAANNIQAAKTKGTAKNKEAAKTKKADK